MNVVSEQHWRAAQMVDSRRWFRTDRHGHGRAHIVTVIAMIEAADCSRSPTERSRTVVLPLDESVPSQFPVSNTYFLLQIVIQSVFAHRN